MAMIMKVDNAKYCQGCGQFGTLSHAGLVGVYDGTALLESNLEVLDAISMHTPYNPALPVLGIYLQEILAHGHVPHYW